MALGLMLGLTASCSDFFDTESTHVIYADQNHLDVASDTIYSLIGILNRLQAIGDRTVLLGEARGDLMDVTDYTSSDLRDVALFNVGDDNQYNVPRDYYAVINNCNYYIAKADTALKNNRNQYLFRSEYAAAKAIRAWTYLQLVTTYGKVPFVTEPILSKEAAERDYPQYGIQEVCDYFLHQDGLQAMVDIEYPNYGSIKSIPSRLFYMPMYLVLGDLNLWAGNYLESAKCYYNYINTRNGSNSTYPTGINSVNWEGSSWTRQVVSGIYSDFTEQSNSTNSELIFMIPGDSVRSEGYYSELRTLFNTSDDNDHQASLVPSQSIIDLSAAQTYCYYNGDEYLYAPNTLEDYKAGDLRLSILWENKEGSIDENGNRYTSQYLYKHSTRNIRLYRRQLVYLRMAEALNRAGYPRFAYQILSSGVNTRIMNDSILPAYRADSALLVQFDFPSTRYILYDSENATTGSNTQGVHSRGCGWSRHNEYYQMPKDTTITDSLALIAWQQEKVEDMIVDEEALEFAFEGYRYYDLLRVALRRNDPNYLADKIYNRRGGEATGISVDLTDKKNWFLHWNGQIGY